MSSNQAHFGGRARIAIWLIVIGCCAWGEPVRGQDYEIRDLAALERSFTRVADMVRPTVVAISTYRDLSVDGGRKVRIPVNEGTGFAIRADGYIATNHHVIEDSDSIDVMLFNGNKYGASIVQIDPRSDLAVLKVDSRTLRVAPLADLSEVRVGQWAFTLGNPFGLAGTDGKTSFSVGAISAIGRSLKQPRTANGKDRYYGNLIETDASINPGSSGGPLFNIHGQVIGVCTAIKSYSGVNEGLGYAVPMTERTRTILNKLADGDVVRYGYLGVGVKTPPQELVDLLGIGDGSGAMVVSLRKSRGPAANAGLREDDIIIKFDGIPVEDHDHLIRLVGATPAGEEVEIQYYRDLRRHSVRVTLGERLDAVAAQIRAAGASMDVPHMTWRGTLLIEPTASFLAAQGYDKAAGGIYVAESPPGRDMYRRGVRRGNLIVQCNGHLVNTLGEFVKAEREDKTRCRLEMADGSVIVLPK